MSKAVKLSFRTSVYMRSLKNYALEEAIRRIASFGYDGIEFVTWGPYAYPKDLEKRSRVSLRKLADNLEVEITSVAPDGLTTFGYVVSADPRLREEGISDIRDRVELAYDLGARIVVFAFPHLPPESDQAPMWRRSVEALKGCAKFAGERDVTIALHPHAGSLVSTAEEAERMINDTGEESLKAMLCLGHVALAGEPTIESIRKLSKLLVLLHLSDWDAKERRRRILGKGDLDLIEIAKALYEVSYQGYLAIEVTDGTEDPDAQAGECMRFFLQTLDPILNPR